MWCDHQMFYKITQDTFFMCTTLGYVQCSNGSALDCHWKYIMVQAFDIEVFPCTCMSVLSEEVYSVIIE